MEITRKPNETDFDYHKRIVFGKLVDKTLADMDYSELAELVYGQPYSSDIARRMMYGSRKTIDILDRCKEESGLNSSDAEDIISEIEAKKLELQAERKRLFDQRRELNKIIAQASRSEHLEECLISAANNLSNTISQIDFYEDCECVGKNEAVLVLCDWHYGMVADNIWNTYNKDLCAKRVTDVLNDTVRRIRFHACSKLHVIILGDMIHGAIHVGARVASEELVCDQLMQVSEILAQAIEYLGNFVEEVTVYTTYGNHARTVQRKEDSIHRDNMERIIPWWLKERLKHRQNTKIISDFEHEIMFLEVCGHGICASHGDIDTVKTSPKLLSTLYQKRFGKDVEYVLLADKHHRESFEELGITAMICGSLCGTDEYANNKRLYSIPSQLLLIVSEEKGVDAEYNLKCN